MILSLRRILALSLGCSMSSGTGLLRIFSCFEIFSPTLSFTPKNPVVQLSVFSVTEITPYQTLGEVLNANLCS